jgi:SAM-dependent methyltransferase
MQWNTFKNTQLDSNTGKPISKDRFQISTGWAPEQLRNQLVLDAGCGAGRFAEIAASFGARVVAIDFSNAVEAAHDNLAASDVDVIQADINALPFAPGTFPFVYCLGVIMHTPNPTRSFHALSEVTAAGGSLVVDVYPKLWRNILFAKYWIRPITKRIAPEKTLKVVRYIFPVLYPVSRLIAKIPFLGHYIRYMIPVVNYEGVYDLSDDDLRTWALLDTFDMWGPAFDQPQSKQTVINWFKSADFEDVEVFREGFFVGRGIKRESL